MDDATKWSKFLAANRRKSKVRKIFGKAHVIKVNSDYEYNKMFRKLYPNFKIHA